MVLRKTRGTFLRSTGRSVCPQRAALWPEAEGLWWVDRVDFFWERLNLQRRCWGMKAASPAADPRECWVVRDGEPFEPRERATWFSSKLHVSFYECKILRLCLKKGTKNPTISILWTLGHFPFGGKVPSSLVGTAPPIKKAGKDKAASPEAKDLQPPTGYCFPVREPLIIEPVTCTVWTSQEIMYFLLPSVKIVLSCCCNSQFFASS